MSLSDDILKRQHLVEARANALSEELLVVLEEAKTKITGKLAELQAKYLSGKPWEDESYIRRKAFLEAQRLEVDQLITELYSEMSGPILEASQDTMNFISDSVALNFTGMQVGGGVATISLDTVKTWSEVHTIEGMVLTEWLTTMGKTTVDRIVAAGREAMILGLSVPNTARLLREKGIEGGIPGLERLARTYLLSASNYANEKAITEIMSDSMEGFDWKYTSVLDGRTCAICGNDDGKMFKSDEPRPSLPRHISCRCLFLPVVNWGEIGLPELDIRESRRPAVKHNGRIVHHRDGTTSTKFKVGKVEHTSENYSQWIKRQLEEDPAFVRRVMGKTRFELFQSGKISLDKMVVDGRIKRLSELLD